MAKVMITITDNADEDGKVDLAADFDPAIQPGTSAEDMTPAQAVALELVAHSMKRANGGPRGARKKR